MIYALLAPAGRRFGHQMRNRVKHKGYQGGLSIDPTGVWTRPETRADRSIPGAGLRRKIFFELAFDPFEILGVGRRFLLLGNIRPSFGIFSVDLEPLFQARLGIRLD